MLAMSPWRKTISMGPLWLGDTRNNLPSKNLDSGSNAVEYATESWKRRQNLWPGMLFMVPAVSEYYWDITNIIQVNHHIYYFK